MNKIGITRNGLEVHITDMISIKDRPIIGYLIYEKGSIPSSNYCEWMEGGKYRMDGQKHKLDIVKIIDSVPMTIQQSGVYELLFEKAYDAVKKLPETRQEINLVKKATDGRFIAN